MIGKRSYGVAGLALCVLAVGCHRSHESYVPSAELSRNALQAGLTAWRDGQAQPGDIPGTDPLVQVGDSRWAGGERLRAFEIVQEEPRNTGKARKFLVRLTPEGAEAPQEVHYLVSGTNPVWVHREEDSDFKESGM
jgi:hypothetical protein